MRVSLPTAGIFNESYRYNLVPMGNATERICSKTTCGVTWCSPVDYRSRLRMYGESECFSSLHFTEVASELMIVPGQIC